MYPGVFIVEDIESRQADVRDFFLTECCLVDGGRRIRGSWSGRKNIDGEHGTGNYNFRCIVILQYRRAPSS
jgi:hypothetical protein